MTWIEELAEMVARSAPAPWEAREHDGLIAICSADGWVLTADGDSLQSDRRDAATVAALRNVAPELIDVVQRAQACHVQNPTDPDLVALSLALDALVDKLAEVLR